MQWPAWLKTKGRRRREARSRPFPDTWRAYLAKWVHYYNWLPPEDQAELEGHIHVFLDAKHFEGCGGMTVDDEVRVAVAGWASVLCLHRETDYYPILVSVLVYPDTFMAQGEQEAPGGVVVEDPDARDGESWDRGAVIIAWESLAEAREEGAPCNVAIHEFAHQLDLENGEYDGVPGLGDADLHDEWLRVCEHEFKRLADAADTGRETVLDPYGASDPAEFFAVVTEAFFETPLALRDKHPRLYKVFSRYFRQDPAVLEARASSKPA